MSSQKKKGMNLERKQNFTGWVFLLPATILIAWMSFYPMIRAFIISLQTGAGANMRFAEPIFSNYKRIMADKVFQQSIANTFLYLIIQVPIMLILGLMFASMLNNKDLRFKGLFRTCIFLPCATSLVSYAMIFRSLFANDGFINTVLRGLGMHPIMWFSNAWTARAVIIIALVWRWTGYNMVFYLSGMQNIEYSIYEAAKIDGCSDFGFFFKIAIPLSKTIIAVMCLFYATAMWNQFFNALMFLQDDSKMPLQVVLRNLVLMNQSNQMGSSASEMVTKQKLAEQLKYCVVVVSAFPLLCVYPFLQKYFAKGVTIGAVKG